LEPLKLKPDQYFESVEIIKKENGRSTSDLISVDYRELTLLYSDYLHRKFVNGERVNKIMKNPKYTWEVRTERRK
jgi:hypothetical protein